MEFVLSLLALLFLWKHGGSSLVMGKIGSGSASSVAQKSEDISQTEAPGENQGKNEADEAPILPTNDNPYDYKGGKAFAITLVVIISCFVIIGVVFKSCGKRAGELLEEGSNVINYTENNPLIFNENPGDNQKKATIFLFNDDEIPNNYL